MNIERYVRCKKCGGVNEIKSGEQRAQILCKLCRNILPIKVSIEYNIVNQYMFDGNKYLERCEFNNAFNAYKKVTELDKENISDYKAEAYFGMAMADFEVCLLTDKVNARVQPICYKVSSEPKFRESKYYKKSLEYANDVQKGIYQDIGARIDKIIGKFNVFKQMGLKWDCFICVKVSECNNNATTEEYVKNGNKTADCQVASNIYTRLLKDGFKPFFSEMDCVDFAGEDYEALILYALYTTPCMLVVCDNKEYLRTPWVQNECARYRKFIKDGKHKEGSMTLYTQNTDITIPLEDMESVQSIQRDDYAYHQVVDYINKFKEEIEEECLPESEVVITSEMKELIDRANNGDSKSKLLLAENYFDGKFGLKKSHCNAYQLFKEVADSGNAYGRYMQGRCKYTSSGILQSPSESANAFKSAAELGCVEAQYEIGNYYFNGYGVDKDIKLALRWLSKSAKRGYTQAQEKLAEIYRDGNDGIAKSKSKSKKAINYNKNLALKLCILAILTIGITLFVGIFGLTDKHGVNLHTLTWQIWLVGICVSVLLSIVVLLKLIWYLKSYYKKNKAIAVLLLFAMVFSAVFGGISIGNVNIVNYYYDKSTGLYYSINNDDTLTVWVEEYNMSSLVVPAEIDGKKVKIYKEPIQECVDGAKITSVIFSQGIEIIDDRAFVGCDKLVKVTVPYGVTAIGEKAFSDCDNMVSISIPDTVRSVGDNAFLGCNNLTIYCEAESEPSEWSFSWNPDRCLVYWGSAESEGYQYQVINGDIKIVGYVGDDLEIFIPTKINNKVVTAIGDSAFKENGYIKSVSIPETVKSIGNKAFYKCNDLKDVSIAEGVTSIGESAFASCRGLVSISIPYSMTSIGDNAFNSCDKLTNIILLDQVVSIGENVFKNCDLLTIDCEVLSKQNGWADSWNPNLRPIRWGYNENPNYIFEVSNGKVKIMSYVGEDANIIIPNKLNGKEVISLESSAFKNNERMLSISMPDTVTYIGANTFEGCTALTSIYIPSGVTSIGIDAFGGCSNIVNATMPTIAIEYIPKSKLEKVVINGGESIDQNAFSHCSSLTSIEIPSSVTSIGFNAFEYCSSLISIKIPNGITSINSGVFSYCSSLTSIDIPSGLTVIGDYAFWFCSSLTSIEIPSSVTRIGKFAFCHCESLTGSIEVPSGVTSIEGYAFSYCSLTSVMLPNSLTSIEGAAFRGCSSLTSIEIPSGVTSIGHYAFYGCSNLININIPNGVTSIGDEAFVDCDNIINVTMPTIAIEHIPQSKLEKVVINGGEKIEDNAFSGCSNLTSVEITNNVMGIGTSAFSNCSSLINITLPFVGATKDGTSNTHLGYIFGASRYSENSDYVPSTLKEVIITNGTSIGSSAFYNCNRLTSIEIPSSVMSIGDGAFYNCSGLTSIYIPSGLTNIGEYAFTHCSNLTSIEIPSSVTSIGYDTFYGCSNLINIKLPFVGATKDGTSNTHLGYIFGASRYSENSDYVPSTLKEVIITNGTSIGSSAFYNCNRLTSIEIPSSVTSIGDYTFYGCSGLTSIKIPSSVTSIGWRAFEGCSSLTSIEIPNSVTSIGYSAFRGCSNLINIKLPFVGATKDGTSNTHLGYIFGASRYSENSDYVPSTLKEVIITNGTSIGSSAFYNCNRLTSIEIPSSVMSIGDYTFYGCSGLTSIEIPGSVTSIGFAAFRDCSSLTSIEIPSRVTSIANFTFSGCSSLTSIEIPSSVTRIGYSAFSECSNLTIYCEATGEPSGWNSAWNSRVVWGYNNITTDTDYDYVVHNDKVYLTKYKGKDSDVVIPSAIDNKEVMAFGVIFKNNEVLTSIKIPSCVISICSDSFYGCSSLTSIEIPSSVTSIGSCAFENCSNLEDVYITDIESWCAIHFENYSSNPLSNGGNLYLNKELVINLVIPSGATRIGDYAFRGCSSLTSIEIHSGVTSIGSSAFYNCSGLTSIYIPSGLTNIGEYAFTHCSNLTSIEIPSSVTSIGYATFYGCSNLTSVLIPSSVTSIGDYAFYGCNSLTSVLIPSSVTSIGRNAFNGCSNLISIEIPSSVTSIGYATFYGCSNLTSVLIPSSVTSIEGYAFRDCSNLTSIEIPSSVTSIGFDAFGYCSNLTSIEIPSSVTNIGSGAFFNCSSLTSIEMPSGVTSIGWAAFWGCSSLTSIVIPSSVTSIGEDAFCDCSNLTIYCEAESKPSGWDSDWNYSDRPVVWGYKANADSSGETNNIICEAYLKETPYIESQKDILY